MPPIFEAVKAAKWWWAFHLCAVPTPDAHCFPIWSEPRFETEIEAIENMELKMAFWRYAGMTVKDPLWSKE